MTEHPGIAKLLSRVADPRAKMAIAISLDYARDQMDSDLEAFKDKYGTFGVEIVRELWDNQDGEGL